MTLTLTARGPEDLLAVVPVVLGFRPAESLVMLTFGGARPFAARLDLPASHDQRLHQLLVDPLLTPCLAQGVQRVAFVAYTGDAALAAGIAASLVPAFVASGVDVVDVLRVEDGHWCAVPVRAGACETEPAPFDDAKHPFAAHAVLDGRVTLESREALRALVAPDAHLAECWRTAATTLAEPGPDEDADVCDLIERLVATGEGPSDAEAARVLRSVSHVDVRDAAVAAVTVATVRDHLRVWSALLRGVSGPAVADVAAVTAFCAWQEGDGALAWCALDRCFEVEPDHVLGVCLSACLERAVPPCTWQESRAAVDPDPG